MFLCSIFEIEISAMFFMVFIYFYVRIGLVSERNKDSYSLSEVEQVYGKAYELRLQQRYDDADRLEHLVEKLQKGKITILCTIIIENLFKDIVHHYLLTRGCNIHSYNTRFSHTLRRLNHIVLIIVYISFFYSSCKGSDRRKSYK